MPNAKSYTLAALAFLASTAAMQPAPAQTDVGVSVPLPLVSAGTPEQQAAIAAVIRDYYEGITLSDRTKMERAFETSAATMVSVIRQKDDPSSVTLRTQKDINKSIDRWTKKGSAEDLGSGFDILSITALDNQLASVALRYGDCCYDMLVLADVNGSWKIIAKTYLTRP